MSKLVALGAAVLSLAGPGVASAAAPWSEPQDLSTPHTFVDAPSLAFGSRDAALAGWATGDGTGASGRGGAAAASRPPGATAFGPEQPLAAPRTFPQRPTLVSAPVVYGATRTLVVAQRPEPATRDGRPSARVRLTVRFGDIAAPLGPPTTLAVRAQLRGVQLASDGAGDAAVAWFEDRGSSDDRVYVALRGRGGRFGRPVLLATDRVRSVSVAVSPRGAVLVAWDARGIVRTRSRAAGRPSFTPTDTITSDPAFYASLRTAITARGRAVVAWTSQLLTEGGSRGPFTAEAAVRPAGARRFRPAQLLERSDDAGQEGVDLVVDGDDATMAWAGRAGAVRRIRVAVTDGTGRFGTPADVSPAGVDAGQPSLAAAGGTRLVAWVQGGLEVTGRLYAAVGAARAAFGAPEEVASGLESRVPDAAVSPSGLPAIVWSQRPDGPAGATFARVAWRSR